MRPYSRAGLLLCLSVSLAAGEEDAFERAPISYSRAVPKDAVSALEKRLASGELRRGG